MKQFRVTFIDTISANTEEEAYGILLDYLNDCARFQDATAFDFQEEPETKEEQTH
jgi:hypothetical protein